MTRRITYRSFRARRERLTGCSPRRNGNMPHEHARRQLIPGAIRSTAAKEVTTADETRNARRAGWFSLRGTQLVGTYSANRWGRHARKCLGMLRGQLADYRGAPDDGSARRGGDASMRILRGGARNYSPSGLRSADRNWFPPEGHTSFIGFHVARQPDARPPDAKVANF